MKGQKSAAGRLACLLLALCVLAGCGGGGGGDLHLPERPGNGYVLDVAGVLESETVDHILKENETLRAATGASVTVVTVDVLGGKDVSEYANRLYETWGVGDNDRQNGLLILLAVEDGTYWLIQGTGVRDDLTDDALRDYAWNYLERDFSEGNYDAGARKLCDALFAWYKDYYAQELDAADVSDEPEPTDAASAPSASAKPSGGTPLWLVIVAVAAAVVIVTAVVLKLRSGGHRRRGRYQGRRRRR